VDAHVARTLADSIEGWVAVRDGNYATDSVSLDDSCPRTITGIASPLSDP